MVNTGLPALRPDFHWDFDSAELPDFRSEVYQSPLMQPPRRPPPMDADIQHAIQRSTNFNNRLLSGSNDLDDDVGSPIRNWQQQLAPGMKDAEIEESPVRKWHRQLTLGTEEQLCNTRMEDLEAVELRAKKTAAENALAAKRLQRRETEISAVEDRARQTMAELAAANLRAKRKEAELQHREDLALEREQDLRRNSTLALESHAAVVEKEKRFDKQVKRTREAIRQEERELLLKETEAQEQIAQMQEETRRELTSKREEADRLLLEKTRELHEQRDHNRRELATHLGDSGTYLENTRADLADREAELAVQAARQNAQLSAREQEFTDWEGRLHAQEQKQLAERWKLLRFREEMQKRIALLDVHSEVLMRKEDNNLVETVFNRWRALSVDALVQMKLSQLHFPAEEMTFVDPQPEPSGHRHRRGRDEVRKPVAWIINPMDAAQKREDQRERRQDVLVSHAQQEQGLIMSSVFFVWRGVVVKRQRAQQSRRRAEKASVSRAELPKGVAWEVKGLQMKKWEVEQEIKVMEDREDDGNQHALYTVFFMWKHLHRDPRIVFPHQRQRAVKAAAGQEFSKPVAWSINTTSWPIAKKVQQPLATSSLAKAEEKEDSHEPQGFIYDTGAASPRAVGNRGKPFQYAKNVQQAATSKLKVVRLTPNNVSETTG